MVSGFFGIRMKSNFWKSKIFLHTRAIIFKKFLHERNEIQKICFQFLGEWKFLLPEIGSWKNLYLWKISWENLVDGRKRELSHCNMLRVTARSKNRDGFLEKF